MDHATALTEIRPHTGNGEPAGQTQCSELPSALGLQDPRGATREGETAQWTGGMRANSTNKKFPNEWSPGKQGAESENWYFSISL